ncbi:hypothetical protein [Nocardia nepalensis]|uniref:hypothetical protein n=1 Tax=Nocardia nepalensis TaxID=3375448 RepID=UPI003B66B085
MLDAGAPGLQYFEHYLPRYAKVFANFGYGNKELCGDNEYTKLCAKYDSERDMDLAQLDSISTTFEKIVISLNDELNVQRTQRSALASVWQGQAGDAALNMLDAQVKRAEADHDHAIGISLTLKSATAGLRSIVKAKAETVDKYWNRTQPDIPDGNGRGRKEIDIQIELGINYPGSDQGKNAKKWLREIFVPHVEGTVTKFEELCKTTEDSIRRLYGDLEKALNTLDTGAYPMPADTTKNDPGPGPSNPGPSSSSPGPSSSSPGPSSSSPGPSSSSPGPSSSNSPGSTPSTTTSTSTTTASSLLSGLASLTSAASQLTSLGESVGQGLTSLGTSIKDGFENAVKEIEKVLDPDQTEDKDGDGKPDSTKADKFKAEFDLAGKHLKLEIGADGQPKFVMTDGDGKTHEYGVKLDDKGNLTVSTDEPKGEDDKSTSGDKPAPESTPEKSKGDTSASEGTPAGQSGTVPGTPSSGRREEDGEHYPQQLPNVPQPGEPADSGAKLAEAGPL